MPDTEAPSQPASNSNPLDIPPPRRSVRRLFRAFFFRVWLPLIALFVGYLWFSYQARGFDSAVLRSDDRIDVRDDADRISFGPKTSLERAALILIPGAMVEPTAYAPLARAIAERGHRVVIVKLPWRMASSDSQRAGVVARVVEVIRADDPSTKWVVGGHSVGAVVACRVASEHGDLLSGLALLGTSHPRDVDLSHMTIPVTKITATNDGLASPAEVRANASKLPPQTRWVEIDGGNHSQFGYYGFQLGDRRASISREAQQEQTVSVLLELLDRTTNR